MHFLEIFENKVLGSALLAWFIAQDIKVIRVLITEKRCDFTKFVSSGSMPSSHSAFVTALATAVGLTAGFNSLEFAISACFAVVVMYDACGVRRAAGEQAKVLNKVVDTLEDMHTLNIESTLKELLGHTKLEVIAGFLLGVLVSLIIIK